MSPDQWLMLVAVVCEVVAALNVVTRPAIRFEWLGVGFFFATFLTN